MKPVPYAQWQLDNLTGAVSHTCGQTCAESSTSNDVHHANVRGLLATIAQRDEKIAKLNDMLAATTEEE